MTHAQRATSTIAELDDYPTLPDTRYGVLAADNNWTGANTYTNGLIIANNVRPPLTDATNGDYFLETIGGAANAAPVGWTTHAAGTSSSILAVPGYWRVFGNNATANIEYSRQTTVGPTDTSPNQYRSWQFGETLLSYNDWPGDITWYLSANADDGAGNRNPDIFNRVAINWDSANAKYQIRQEVKDGTTQQDSAWVELGADLFIHNSIYVRLAIRNNNDGRCRAYIGQSAVANVQRKIGADLLTGVPAASWGNVHYSVSRDRVGGGLQDYILFSAVDTNTFT